MITHSHSVNVLGKYPPLLLDLILSSREEGYQEAEVAVPTFSRKASVQWLQRLMHAQRHIWSFQTTREEPDAWVLHGWYDINHDVRPCSMPTRRSDAIVPSRRASQS